MDKSIIAPFIPISDDNERNILLKIVVKSFSINWSLIIKIIMNYSSDVQKIRALDIFSKGTKYHYISTTEFCDVLRSIGTTELKFVAFLGIHKHLDMTDTTCKDICQILEEITLEFQKISAYQILVSNINTIEIESAVNILNIFPINSIDIVDPIIPKIIFPFDVTRTLAKFNSDHEKYICFILMIVSTKYNNMSDIMIVIKQLQSDLIKKHCIDIIADKFFFFHEFLVEILSNISDDNLTIQIIKKITKNQSNFSEAELLDICNCVATSESKYRCIQILNKRILKITNQDFFCQKINSILCDSDYYQKTVELLKLNLPV
jgi:hypothetical protein